MPVLPSARLTRHDRWCRRPEVARRHRPGARRRWPSRWWRSALPPDAIAPRCWQARCHSAPSRGDAVGLSTLPESMVRPRSRAGRSCSALIDHRAAGPGIAGGVGDLRGQHVAATAQRDAGCSSCRSAARRGGAQHRALPSGRVTVLPASATSTVPVMVCAAWLVAPPLLVIATTGAVVSRVKLSEAVPVLPKLSVWLATMVWAPSESPLGRERPGPGGVSRHGGGDRAAVDGEVHHGVGKPGAAQRVVRGDMAARRANQSRSPAPPSRSAPSCSN